MASKINLVVRLQHWMDSVPGQTFLNYAYSWGASIVILGALFKLTHLPGGNTMLFLGMGTEVVVFFLSAFDRPFDKNEIGRELPEDYETDEEIAERMGLTTADEPDAPDAPDTTIHIGPEAAAQPAGVVIIGGGAATVATAATVSPASPEHPDIPESPASPESPVMPASPEKPASAGNEAERLADLIRAANDELLHRAQATLAPGMEEATEEYIAKMRTLTETIAKVDEQSARLAKDSEEMENLNRTLTGINKVYELHLKGISMQVGTIEEINAQTQRLAKQIEDLNHVYSRMIEALTINMRSQGGNTQTPA
ncbi:MAG: gliding motility protein GldL [Bacteroidales bacterium]|nr:gliding motility protein GldL [Bacteroidales bacterium]